MPTVFALSPRAWLLGWFFTCSALPGWAAVSVDPAIPLLRAERQSQREEATRPPTAAPVGRGEPQLGARPEEIAEPQPLLQAPTLVVIVNGLVPAERIDAILAPYQPLALGRNRLEHLLRQLTAQLVSQGLVTSRARLSRLDRAANRVEIELVAGRIEALASSGKPLPAGVKDAFPKRGDDLLVLQDLEQGIHQIQRLRRYQAEMRVLPGQAPDTSLLDLHLAEAKPWWLQFGLDSQGARATGTVRSRATVTLEDTLGLLDSFGVSLVRSQRSEAAVATLAAPMGYDTWSVSYAASRYRQFLPNEQEQTGGSHTASLAWNRVLHLSAAGRDSADVSLTYGDAWRRVDEIPLSPERLTVLKAALTCLRQGEGWRAWGEGGLARGLAWFGAPGDRPGLPAAAPHVRFTKVEGHAGLIVAPAGLPLGYTGQVDVQYSPVGLYGPEQFRLGGMTSVRGFDETIAAGDRGTQFRHELNLRTSQSDADGGTAMPFVFIDHGAARLVSATATRLAGAGFGVRLAARLAARPWSADLVLARPIDHNVPLAHPGWHLHATLRIDL